MRPRPEQEESLPRLRAGLCFRSQFRGQELLLPQFPHWIT